MKEEFLHYVWQFQLFEKKTLRTEDGRSFTIISTGTLNKNSGPDFLNAQIEMDELKWHGHVEIHIDEKDWFNHNHHHDESYKNVILHVIWNHQNASTGIATLQLKNLVDPQLLNRYEKFISSKNDIPCAPQIETVNSFDLVNMQEKALLTRLERKSQQILDLLNERNGDWEQLTFEILGRAFGFKVNSEVFADLCKKTPFTVIRKISSSIFQLEAVLFGQSGLLESGTAPDEYTLRLKKEYQYLSRKYDLHTSLKASEWKFSRSRPRNFPTLRIAQFAALIHKNSKLFSALVLGSSSQQVFEIKHSDYWKEHFRFGTKSEKATGNLGKESRNNLLINVSAPLIFSYGLHYNNQEYKDKAIGILENTRPEKNRITERWSELELEVKNASSSQSLIEMYNEFCLKKRCLSCTIGASIIR